MKRRKLLAHGAAVTFGTTVLAADSAQWRASPHPDAGAQQHRYDRCQASRSCHPTFMLTALAANHLRQGDVDDGVRIGRDALSPATGCSRHG